MAQAIFRVYTLAEFEAYIKNTVFERAIRFIQNHHTWQPSYTSFNSNPDHMHWLEVMRNHHINVNKWADIGQNITTFPDGKIAVCRPLDVMPAGIRGANEDAICIEHLGNFDAGKDVMTAAQKTAIIKVNALLCFKHTLQPVATSVVYHHWFDTTGKRFPAAMVNSNEVNKKQLQKTCPGTAFFGGNRIIDTQTHFFPQVQHALNVYQGIVPEPQPGISKKVTASSLNVRKGRGTRFAIVKKLPNGSLVQVFTETEGWSKISNTAEEWVSSAYLGMV